MSLVRRFYSHYTFIYPDKFLRNFVVEIDSLDRISNYFPFEKELFNTEYTSGLQIFVPVDLLSSVSNEDLLHLEPQLKILLNSDTLIRGFSV